MNPQLAAVAAANGGVFTRRHARQCGYTDGQIRARLASGRWRRLRPGCYLALTSETGTPEGVGEDRRRDAAHRVAAARLRVGRDAVGGHLSAAIVHGLPLPFVDTAAVGVTLVRPPVTRRRRLAYPDGLVVRPAALPPQHVTRRFGVPVTSPARTAFDLARRLPFAAAVVVLEHVMHNGVRRKELDAVSLFCHEWPGRRQAGRALAFADARTETALESVSRVMFQEYGVPMPEPQVWLRGVTTDMRVDFYWRRQRMVGEADGLGKYFMEPEPWAVRRRIKAEREREKRLAEMGFVLLRWTWDDAVFEGARTSARILAALAIGDLRRLA